MKTAQADERLRIAYWRDAMEQGRRFLDRMMEYPVHESEEPLVSIRDAARSAGVEMEFSNTSVVENIARIFEVRAGLIESLLAAAHEMNERGWVLKIEDGFRTAEIQRKLAHKPGIFDVVLRKVIWESGGGDADPEVVMRRVSTVIANAPKLAGHMSGCAVDVSVLDRGTRAEVDRGAPYLEMSELTPMGSPFVSPEALHHRFLITAIMEHHGFAGYPWEFWHYSQGDVFAEHLRCTGKVARYAAVERDPRTGTIAPVTDLKVELTAIEEVREEVRRAGRRIKVR